MARDIKDYLHLYLGCECWNEDGDITRLDGRFIDWVQSGKYPGLEIPKPILRPLSDMTDAEALEFFGKVMGFSRQFQFSQHSFKWKSESGYISIYDHSTSKWYVIIKPSATCSVPCFNCTYSMEETLWLLHKGFDLFGLIEVGLALDKSKLPVK